MPFADLATFWEDLHRKPTNFSIPDYSLSIIIHIVYIISDGLFDEYQSTKSIPSKQYFIMSIARSI